MLFIFSRVISVCQGGLHCLWHVCVSNEVTPREAGQGSRIMSFVNFVSGYGTADILE